MCHKQGIEILNKNEIFNKPVDFTEYEIDEKWAYAMVLVGLESYECDIVIMSEKQDPNLMLILKNRQRPINEVLNDVQK